jgi:hypothetical protein
MEVQVARTIVVIGVAAVVLIGLAALLMLAPALMEAMPRHRLP